MLAQAFIRYQLTATTLMLVTAAANVFAQTNLTAARDIATGPFQPTWESLAAQYQCPEWFSDAKFGIWAVWGPQCQPEDGDWYARSLYQQGSAQNKFHVEHYGPPSKFGFKDIIPLWKGENFHPDELLAFYKKSGAKYFLAMANHHDNFDLYDSKYQPWNSVALGPKKDIIGLWAHAARKNGLRFAVSVHASHAWSWYEPTQGADQDGPLAGVPYDGKLTKADGKGLWWDGMDPQDLYAQNHAPGTQKDWEWWEWNAAKGCSLPDAAYVQKFFLRTKQLWDDYRPDMIYFDDTVLPFHGMTDEIGLDLAAHFYNSSIQWHGRNEAVMNAKHLDPQQRKALVYDLERGKAAGILPEPWQTDTCLGDWHYQRQIFEKHQYKSAATIIPMLADIVSKNGNLMLSVPVRGDGTIDSDEVKTVGNIGAWLKVNGEAIYATRPWKVFGEGPAAKTFEKGQFDGQSDTHENPFTPEDIRFTQSKDGKTLYAIVLAFPADGRVTIQSLAENSPQWPGKVDSVRMLGIRGKLKFVRDDKGLHLTLPDKKPCDIAFALKITG
ncbi:MAG: alpha-L-fucosidase [Verrucomicrobiia bacterium]